MRAVKATAAAVEAYLRVAKAGDEAIQAAREIRVRAGRKLGKEIKAARKKGELARKGGDRRSKSGDGTLKLGDIGLDKKEAAEAVALAGEGEDPDDPAPEELFEAALEEARRTGETSETAVVALMAAGARAAAALPPGASPAAVTKAIKRAMEGAAGVRRDPSPREADRLAREGGGVGLGLGRPLAGREPPPSREEAAEHDRLVAVRLAAYACAGPARRWRRRSTTRGGCAPPSATRKGPPRR